MGRMGSLVVSLFLVSLIFSSLPIGSTEAVGQENEVPVRDISNPSVEICDWRWNRTGAVSLTFDDGLNSQAMIAAPILAQRDLDGTFFITTDNCEIPFGANWTDWQNVSDMGHEIGSHTISHPDLRLLSPENLTKEVVGSREIIEENLTGVDVETFSYPMGRYNDTVLQLVASNYLAARMDAHNISGPPKPESKHPENMYSVVPCNFGSGQTASDLSALVNDTIASEGWLVEMIHAVGSGGYDPVSLADFTTHLDLLVSRENELWIDTFLNVSKYIRERENSDIEVTYDKDTRVNISLNSSLSEDHNIPLTLDIRLPSDWKDVDVHIGGSIEHVQLIHMAFYSRLYLDVEINSNISITKNNTPPEILHGYENLPITPLTGDSDTVFEFYSSYWSEMWRPLQGNISILFDLNNDGDSMDEVNGMKEMGYFLEYITQADCPNGPVIYGIEITFPPGIHEPGFFLQGIDSAGLYSREPDEGYFKGPEINNPPPAPEDLEIMNYHDLSPTFKWGEVEDPDGDNVTYDLVLEQNGSTIWSDFTENTFFTSSELDFDLDYRLFLNASDEFGYSSGNVSLNFTLRNSPPDTPMNLTVSDLHSLSPLFSWDPPIEPEGDEVTVNYTLRTLDVHGPWNLSGRTLENSVSIEYKTIIDPSNIWFENDHEFELEFIDQYGSVSERSSITFRPENQPPTKVSNIRVTETRSLGPNISFDPSIDPDGDRIDYRLMIKKKGSDEAIHTYWTSNSYDDLPDIYEEGEYTISIMARDSLNMVSNTTFFNLTIDLRPDPVQFIFIEDRGAFEGGVYLQWAYGHDLLDEISGFFVYAYDSNPQIDQHITPLQKLDVWKNTETWVGNLTDGQDYWFTIVAYNEEGRESQQLTFVNGTPYDLVPPSKARMLQTELVKGPYGCRLQWQIPDPFDLDRIMVYRAEGEAPYDAATLTPIHVIDDWRYGGTSWLDTSIEKDNVYYYCVVTLDENGNAATRNLIWAEVNTSVENDIPDEEHDIEVPEDGFEIEPCVVPVLIFIILVLVMVIVVLVLKNQRRNDGLYYVEE